MSHIKVLDFSFNSTPESLILGFFIYQYPIPPYEPNRDLLQNSLAKIVDHSDAQY